jgi:hypothetical protein
MRISAVILLAVVVTACTDSTAPPPPASVEASVSTPSGIAGLPLAAVPSLSVRDASGNILGGVAISVAVTSGGGTLTNAPRATLSGAPTPVGTWTLGRLVGVNTLTVTVADLPPLLITVKAVAGPLASLLVIGGNGQAALGGTELPVPLLVQLRDQFGNGIPSTMVTFVVTNGGGTIAPGSVMTDAESNAGGIAWRLGKSAVRQTGIVSAGGVFTSVTATVATDFKVDVRFFGPSPPAEAAAAAFLEAAARITGTIVGDILDVDYPTLRNNAGVDITACGAPGIVVNEIVDDVLIYASVGTIDGVGKILATATPCVVRSQSRMASIGVMRFDVDDVGELIQSGRLADVVLHEMLHVVGFGTIWTDSRRPGGVLLTGRGTDNPRYTGSLGISACSGAGGTEACGGGVAVEGLPSAPGTADSHWRESTFDSELMTGFVEPAGTPMSLSAITIQSLADVGYSVNLFAGDQYLVPLPAALNAPGNQSRSVLAAGTSQWEVLGEPILEISPNGQLRQTKSH